MPRKIRTRKNKKYNKRGGFLGFGENTSSFGKPKRTWNQYFGFASETPAIAPVIAPARTPYLAPPQQSYLAEDVPKQPVFTDDMGMIRGGQRRRHISSRAGGKRVKRTRKYRK